MDNLEIKGFIKTADLEIQRFKVADKKERIIEGFFTTTEVDRGGDVSLTSAFEKTMPEYMKNPILTYMHQLDKVMGKVLDYKVIEGTGIWIKAQVARGVKWVDEEVWPLMEQGIVKGFSYGYSTKDEERGAIEGKEVNFLKEVDLYEIAIATLPMNGNALFNVSSTGAVKSLVITGAKEIQTPETKVKNTKEEDIIVEKKIDELLQGIKTLADSVKSISDQFANLDAKSKEFSVAVAEATVTKIKELEDLKKKEEEEAEAKAKEIEDKETDTEQLESIKEINEAMSTIIELLVKKEDKTDE